MKAGHKISIIYSGITIGLVLIAGLVFYFFSSNYIRNLYSHYMQEKAHAVAEEKFSKDELDPVKYRNVVIRRQTSIPTSKELFVNPLHPYTKSLISAVPIPDPKIARANKRIPLQGDKWPKKQNKQPQQPATPGGTAIGEGK